MNQSEPDDIHLSLQVGFGMTKKAADDVFTKAGKAVVTSCTSYKLNHHKRLKCEPLVGSES